MGGSKERTYVIERTLTLYQAAPSRSSFVVGFALLLRRTRAPAAW
jgi:hypothetical protein